MFRWFEYSQVYQPSRVHRASGADLGRRWEDVYFAAEDGPRLNGWYFPAGAASARSRRVILFCHGNKGNLGHYLHFFAAILESGVNLMAFDYRGYGRSSGFPSEKGTYRDAAAAFNWLRSRGFAPNDVIVYGESLGGGIASELALQEPSAGLVLQAAFTSVPDLGEELFPWLPVRWLSTIQYATRTKLPRLRIPVMITHSRDDRLIGFHHAQGNFAAANEPKLLWELKGAHHDPIAADRDQFREGIERILVFTETAAH